MIDPATLLDPVNIAVVVFAINFLAFALFGIDKWKARTGRWRTSEATLLWLALIGGTPGAYLGRRVFRHKTRKQPFVSNLHAIAWLQVLSAAGWIGWQLAG